MKGNAAHVVRLGGGLLCLVALGWVLTGQAAKPANRRISVPTDWSHRHLIFSQPGSPELAARVSQDDRYWQQIYRRQQRLVLPEAATGGVSYARHRVISQNKLHRDWAEDLGVGASAGAGNYPAKFSFDITTAHCGSAATPDYVIYSTGLPSSASQASIIAFDNLYSGCTGTVPSGYWAYDTGGQVLTSPSLSRNGTQTAFVQTNAGAGSLVLLKWAKSLTETVGLPQTLTGVSPAAYQSCATPPCMTTFPLVGGDTFPYDDTMSSVFYDFNHDVAWVGDSGGWLHKFTPVFNGTPAEVTTAPWPVQVNPGAPASLTSPVYDRLLDSVFVEDIDGIVYRVASTTGAVVASGQLDFGGVIVQSPVVDVSNGLVYVFVSSDGSGSCNVFANDCSGVIQLPAAYPADSTGTEAIVGSSAPTGTPPTNPLFIGGFDNSYYTSLNVTGNLYVCGNTGLIPTLYQVPIQAGVMGTGIAISTLATTGTSPACSPVTDFSAPSATPATAATERLFFSVQDNSTTCAAGCISNFVDTPWQASKAFSAGQTILFRGASPLSRFVNIVQTAGTSGATQPIWVTTAGATKADGTITWINQGNPASAPTTPNWVHNTIYAVGGRILDTNLNLQAVKSAGAVPHRSGANPPTWNTTIGANTTDGNITWVNVGHLPTVGLAATGGTSGIIVDNYVPSGTLAGASQVYFTTLGDQNCGPSGPDGCAIQASQPALQ